ncbi:glycosyltransferase family 2 protein [bacterium]|nr:glycosyltransferase family 2 protein [bacterium]
MSQVTLSAILCNYNHSHFIREALQSILDQSCQPDEVVLVDDGSTDNSVQVIEEFINKNRCSTFRLFKNEQNQGLMSAGNRALELTSGDYIVGLAADDRWLPGYLENSMNVLTQYPQAALCCSDFMTFEDETGHSREHRLYLSDRPAISLLNSWLRLS